MAGIQIVGARGGYVYPDLDKQGIVSLYNGTYILICIANDLWESTDSGVTFSKLVPPNSIQNSQGFNQSPPYIATSIGYDSVNNNGIIVYVGVFGAFLLLISPSFGRTWTYIGRVSNANYRGGVIGRVGVDTQNGLYHSSNIRSNSNNYAEFNFLGQIIDGFSRAFSSSNKNLWSTSLRPVFHAFDFEHDGGGRNVLDVSSIKSWGTYLTMARWSSGQRRGGGTYSVRLRRKVDNVQTEVTILNVGNIRNVIEYMATGLWIGNGFFYCYVDGSTVKATKYTTVNNSVDLGTSPSLSSLSVGSILRLEAIKISTGVAIVALLSTSLSNNKPQLYITKWRQQGVNNVWSDWEDITKGAPNWTSGSSVRRLMNVERFPSDDFIRVVIAEDPSTSSALNKVWFYQVPGVVYPSTSWETVSQIQKFIDEPITFEWEYSSLTNSLQNKFYIKRRANSTIEYYNGTSWVSDKTGIVGVSSSLAISNWYNVNTEHGETIYFTIQVEDATGLKSDESDEITFSSIKDAGLAVITSPVDGEKVIGVGDIVWTTPLGQEAYRVDLFDNLDVLINSSGWIVSDIQTYPIRGTNGTLTAKVYWRNSRSYISRNAGIRNFILQLAPPKSVSLVFDVGKADGTFVSNVVDGMIEKGIFIKLKMTLSSSGEDLSEIRIYRREFSRTDHRKIRDIEILITTFTEGFEGIVTYEDFTIAHGVQYQYLIERVGVNGSVVRNRWIPL